MMARVLIGLIICAQLWAAEAPWAERSGSDAQGAWAEISVGGTPQRLRWRTFGDGAQAWLGEAPLPPAAVKALIPDIPDPRSLRWRGEQDIADVHAICDAVERSHPRLRCLLPRLAWLQQAFPQPRADWPRLWTGDLVQGWVAYQPIGGTRFDDVLASRLWGPPWSAAELVEPPFPKPEPDRDEFSEEDRYGFTSDGNEPKPWVRPIDRIGRANDGQVPLAALRRVRKSGEAHAAGEPEGAALGLVLAVVEVRGPGAVAQAAAGQDGPQALIAPGHQTKDAVVVSISPDGMRAATAGGDGVRLWDIGRGLSVGALRRGDAYGVDGALMTWSDDSSRLYTVGQGGSIECWKAVDASLVWHAEFEVDDGSWVGHAAGLTQFAMENAMLSMTGDGRRVRVTQVLGQGRDSWCLHYDAITGEVVTEEPVWMAEPGTEQQGEDEIAIHQVQRAADQRRLPGTWRDRPVVVEEAGCVAVCDGLTLRRWRLPGLEAMPEIRLPEHDRPRADAVLTALDPAGARWLFFDGTNRASVIDTVAQTVQSREPGACGLVRKPDGSFTVENGDGSAISELLPGARVRVVGTLPAGRGAGLRFDGGYAQLSLMDGERMIAEMPIRPQRPEAIAFAAADALIMAAPDQGWRIDLARIQVTGGAPRPPDLPTIPEATTGVAANPYATDTDPTCPGPDGGVWVLRSYGEWELVGPDGAVRHRLAPDPLRRTGGRRQTACAAEAGLFVASDGKGILCREADGALRWWTDAGEPPESPVRRLAISPDGRLIASLGEGVALWRAADGVLLCRFAGTPGGPVAVTPDGHYAMRGDPGSFVAFRWDGATWPVTEFDLQRNRPDLVAAAIGLADAPTIAGLRLAWEGRCRRLGVSPTLATQVNRLPRARIAHASLPLVVEGSSVELPVQVDAVPAGATLVVRVDEVPVPSRAGTPITGTQEKRTLALVPGMNRIAVSVRLPDGREGLRDTAWVVSRAAPAPPRLHVLAVGCSRYRAPGLDLDFAAKDARDLVAGLSPATAIVVADAEATREGIASAAARLRAAAPQDAVAVFLAGHGVLDEAGNYWFLTHDADPAKPAERALGYAAIEDLLESCPARRRVVLLDTCHAGELDGEGLVAVAAPQGAAAGVRARGLKAWKSTSRRPSFEFLDLRSGVGAAVLASSAGLEFALESAEWSNGVFTLAVLEGWARSQADADGDGAVRVGELSAYVAARVSALTGGTQNPALRSANRSVDAVLRTAP